MATKFTNKQIAEILRNISAVYQIIGENQFKIRAYDLAADAVEHATSDLATLWSEGSLDQIPRLGEGIRGHLEEMFDKGRSKHFDSVLKKVPKATFEFLKISGVGPKTALRVAEIGVLGVTDLENKIKTGWLSQKGFSEKSLKNILRGIEEYRRKSDRMLLPEADEIANKVLTHLRKHPSVRKADTLGSLRRKVETIGDIDISIASEKPKDVINHFKNTPDIESVIEAGDNSATIALKTGVHVDIMIQTPDRYGSLLQHFTGSKLHNIRLRSFAKDKNLSLSEYGIKKFEGKGKKFSQDPLLKAKTEEEFYKILGMEYIPPELREDRGEIEAAEDHTLPKLIKESDVKGDLQTHSYWSDGQDSVKAMGDDAAGLGREYIALTDHSYPSMDFEARLKEIEQYNYSQNKIRVISGLEVNINADSTLQVPDEVLAKHEVVLVSIHTSFRQPREVMTKRIIKALENPHVDIFAHPTGRLLLEREGIDADWEKIFKAAAKLNKFLEINSFPSRLDLPGTLIQEAKRFGVKFSIGTDAHQARQLSLINYGVFMARRGWLEKEDVLNTLPYNKIKGILGII